MGVHFERLGMTGRLYFRLMAALVVTAVGCAPAERGARVHVLASESGATKVGPSRGSLVIAGGGQLGAEIISSFITLAGGPGKARIVVIPTAGEADTYGQDWPGADMFRRAGVKHVTVVHTRDRVIADSEPFIAPLREATGVWFPGGRQWRIVDSYLGTRTQRELERVLARGGVIGGTSAGASVQASYMVRGARSGNTIVMATGYETGFGLMRNTAIDQHLLARNRQDDMLQVISRYPHLLGIGVDEGTAIVVRGDTAAVIGRSKAAFYNTDPANSRVYFYLTAGDRFDLATRSALPRPRP